MKRLRRLGTGAAAASAAAGTKPRLSSAYFNGGGDYMGDAASQVRQEMLKA
jgi:hypothetical protein